MSRATTITGPLAACVERAGGVAALAEAWGIGTATLHRWGTGRSSPSPLAARAVNEWARRRGLEEPFGAPSGRH